MSFSGQPTCTVVRVRIHHGNAVGSERSRQSSAWDSPLVVAGVYVQHECIDAVRLEAAVRGTPQPRPYRRRRACWLRRAQRNASFPKRSRGARSSAEGDRRAGRGGLAEGRREEIAKELVISGTLRVVDGLNVGCASRQLRQDIADHATNGPRGRPCAALEPSGEAR